MRGLAAVLAVFCAARAAAQTASEAITVHILEVEAVVVDRLGAPVTNLTADDFEVRINGAPAPVVNFYSVRRGAIQESAPSSQTTAVAAPPVPSQILIVTDDLHTTAGAKKRALDALQSYVRTAMTANTTATLIRWNGTMSIKAKPTKERETLRRELGSMLREPVRSIAAAGDRRRVLREIEEVFLVAPEQQLPLAEKAMQSAVRYAEERHRDAEMTIEALRELITFAGGLTGRKMVLFVSEGVPLRAGSETLEYARDALEKVPGFRLDTNFGGRALDDLRFDLTARFRALAAHAQSSNVVFSVLDPGGLRGYESTSIDSVAGQARLDSTLMRANESDGMRMVAFQTGGRYVGNENDLEHAVALLTDDVSTYYSIGVRASEAKRYDVKVRVRGRDDLRVFTARRRDLATPEEVIAGSVRARLYSRETQNPLDVKVTVLPARLAGGKCVVPAQVTIPPGKLTPVPNVPPRVDLSIHAIALDDRQQESSVRSTQKQLTPNEGEPIVETLVFGYQRRRYVVSLAIVDGVTGEASYVQTDVDATSCN